jgi:hypothetical protein
MGFFLPFLTVSCGTQEITVSGVELFTSDSLSISDLQTLPLTIVLPAVFIVVAIVVGIVAGFLRQRFAPIVGVVAGLLGTANMFLLKTGISNELLLRNNDASIPGDGGGIGNLPLPGLGDFLRDSGLIQVKYLVGYWLALGCFLIALIVNIWLTIRSRRE